MHDAFLIFYMKLLQYKSWKFGKIIFFVLEFLC